MDEYVKVVRILMSVIGQWPYQTLKTRRILRTSNLLSALTLHLPMFVKIYRSRHDIEVLLLSFPTTITALMLYTSWAFLTIKNEQILSLFNQVVKDFKFLEPNKEEYEILQKSAGKGSIMLLSYGVYVGVSTICGLSVSFITPVLNLIFPVNESRPNIHIVELDYYFFTQDDHFIFASIHTFITCSFGIPNFICCDLLLYSLTQHACGVFRVLRYRLNNITNFENVNDNKQIQRNARECVKLHSQVLSYIEAINLCFRNYLLCTVGVSILSMTFQGAMIVLKNDNRNLVFVFATYYGGLFIRLLYNSQAGQMVLDHSSDVMNNAFGSKWRTMPLKIKKIVLIIMMRSLKQSNVTIGQFSILCIETFSVIQRMIFSYLSVLVSLVE